MVQTSTRQQTVFVYVTKVVVVDIGCVGHFDASLVVEIA